VKKLPQKNMIIAKKENTWHVGNWFTYSEAFQIWVDNGHRFTIKPNQEPREALEKNIGKKLTKSDYVIIYDF
jgi:hypothetical protein